MDVNPQIFYNHYKKRWEWNDSDREHHIQSILDLYEDNNERIRQLNSLSVNRKSCTRIPEEELRELDTELLKECLEFYKAEQEILMELQEKHDTYYRSLKTSIQKMWNFAKEKMTKNKYSGVVYTV